MKNDGKTKTDGMPMKGGMMHEGLKSADRVPMGVTLPKTSMSYMRDSVPDVSVPGPRVA